MPKRKKLVRARGIWQVAGGISLIAYSISHIEKSPDKREKGPNKTKECIFIQSRNFVKAVEAPRKTHSGTVKSRLNLACLSLCRAFPHAGKDSPCAIFQELEEERF